MMNQDIVIENVQSNDITIANVNNLSKSGVTIMTSKNQLVNNNMSIENNNYILYNGLYSYKIPASNITLIRISPLTNIIITGIDDNNNTIGIPIKNETSNNISYEKNELTILLDNIKIITQLEITEIQNKEHFQHTDVKNSCHYVCSNLNLVNILIIIGILILLYYIFTNN
jgi:hypothetical protein